VIQKVDVDTYLTLQAADGPQSDNPDQLSIDLQ
jgi:hypothetical protein